MKDILYHSCTYVSASKVDDEAEFLKLLSTNHIYSFPLSILCFSEYANLSVYFSSGGL